MQIEDVLGIEFLAIITFVALLILAIILIITVYICDSTHCKAFNEAAAVAEPGTPDYATTILWETFNDGIWPIPYIGAAILTPLSLWFMGVPITVLNFAILFFVSFVTIYFMFSFFGHHYLRPLTHYVSDYIEENCPAVADDNIDDNNAINDVCISHDSIHLSLPVDISE
jgi:hypothetical protein